jgi:hypothetical protein
VHPRAGHIKYEGKLLASRGKQFSSRELRLISKIVQECDLLLKWPVHFRPMKQITASVALGLALFMMPALAQTPAQKDAEELSALIKEVQAQQTAIAENQAKIEEKLTALGDTIREARIFSSRGGR